ncbi:hypothetical protein HK100_002737 [Physocladia obscura]|uniref:Uncharacterized protein n=1 Tax=Physocladia obscura TaxID=109957 RepID=A0AAD5SUZ9_9FUNG|nr:hypothetical protein HK100_002737 [Physocladia obscura]
MCADVEKITSSSSSSGSDAKTIGFVKKVVRVAALQIVSPAGLFAVVILAGGDDYAKAVLGEVGRTTYWLEGWGLDVVICCMWPVCLAFMALVGGW